MTEYPRCTKCGEQPKIMPIWSGKENWYYGHCPTCNNDPSEFVGDTTQGGDYDY